MPRAKIHNSTDPGRPETIHGSRSMPSARRMPSHRYDMLAGGSCSVSGRSERRCGARRRDARGGDIRCGRGRLLGVKGRPETSLRVWKAYSSLQTHLGHFSMLLSRGSSASGRSGSGRGDGLRPNAHAERCAREYISWAWEGALRRFLALGASPCDGGRARLRLTCWLAAPPARAADRSAAVGAALNYKLLVFTVQNRTCTPQARYC